jgi:hypothetical protein
VLSPAYDLHGRKRRVKVVPFEHEAARKLDSAQEEARRENTMSGDQILHQSDNLHEIKSRKAPLTVLSTTVIVMARVWVRGWEVVRYSKREEEKLWPEVGAMELQVEEDNARAMGSWVTGLIRVKGANLGE